MRGAGKANKGRACVRQSAHAAAARGDGCCARAPSLASLPRDPSLLRGPRLTLKLPAGAVLVKAEHSAPVVLDEVQRRCPKLRAHGEAVSALGARCADFGRR